MVLYLQKHVLPLEHEQDCLDYEVFFGGYWVILMVLEVELSQSWQSRRWWGQQVSLRQREQSVCWEKSGRDEDCGHVVGLGGCDQHHVVGVCGRLCGGDEGGVASQVGPVGVACGQQVQRQGGLGREVLCVRIGLEVQI